MLHPFLFIGIGGSGGKTLRTLKADLTQRLAEVGYSGPWPSCWQFLHIDVPTVADGIEPDLPGQLDEKDYVGLVGKSVGYRDIDNALTANGRADQEVLRNLLGWRPDPQRVTVPVARGAGQFRVLGRVITLTNLAALSEALKRAMQALSGPQMSADLAAVSRAFGLDIQDMQPGPQAVVVSSLAGGSGSGAFLDICDALRAIGGAGWADDSFAVLYAPDVFEHLDPESRKGVHANALAALCELMAGFWDPDPPIADFAIMEDRGVRVGAPQRRGPRFPLIVGTKNDKVGFSHQNDVYRAMGKALAAWTVSEHLQNDIKAYAAGNWAQSAQLTDRTRLLSPGQEQPLCAIGFARVSLGRDNFAEYSSERLARRAVDRVLHQHLADRPAEADANHEVAIEESVTSNFTAFLRTSGLDERGEKHNEILDALRPSNRSERLAAASESVRKHLVAGRTTTIPARQWLLHALALLGEEQRRFADEEVIRRNDRARDWVRSVQERLTGLVAQSIASVGAPVTDKLMGRLRGELDFVLNELPDEAQKYHHWARQIDELVSGVLRPTQDGLQADNPIITQAIQKGIDCFEYLAEAELRDFAVILTKDLADNLLEPLNEAVRSGKDLLALRAAGAANDPSVVERWPQGEQVPRRFHPAGNEFLLEVVDDYPKMFQAEIIRGASVDNPGGAEAEFVRHTIVGSRATAPGAQSLVHMHTGWVPAAAELHAAYGAPSRARFELRIEPSHLLDRARQLVEDRDSPMGVMVSESLQDYLDDTRVEPAILSKRLDRFRDGFVQALQTSAPLVSVDPGVLMRVHGTSKVGVSYMFTEIPFPDGTPGFDVAKKILESRGQWNDDTARAFSEGRQARIDVFSMLASAYNPIVFESIVAPIANEWSSRRLKADQRESFWRWRRAKPLPGYLPVSPDARLALIRGWFTARLLNLIAFESSEQEAMSIWDPEEQSMLPFPYPLLGPEFFDEWERLPAVLESLPLALLEFAERPQGGEQALVPYWRLRDLGTDARGAEVSYEIVNRDLGDWVLTGVAAPGAPHPKPEFAGEPGSSAEAVEERRSRCIRKVQDWSGSYSTLVNAPLTEKAFWSTPRVSEIGRDLMTALADLEGALRHVDPSKAVGQW